MVQERLLQASHAMHCCCTRARKEHPVGAEDLALLEPYQILLAHQRLHRNRWRAPASVEGLRVALPATFLFQLVVLLFGAKEAETMILQAISAVVVATRHEECRLLVQFRHRCLLVSPDQSFGISLMTSYYVRFASSSRSRDSVV